MVLEPGLVEVKALPEAWKVLSPNSYWLRPTERLGHAFRAYKDETFICNVDLLDNIDQLRGKPMSYIDKSAALHVWLDPTGICNLQEAGVVV